MAVAGDVRLAIGGGEPVRRAPWPAWPGRQDQAIAAAGDALRTGRWTVSGPATPQPTIERRFAAAFAAWNRVGYCVATDHGSSALTIALEAAGIGAGDEVIVPVLTWVASATAVLRVNATPVFADVDPRTGCLSPACVEAAITPKTTAVIAVHLHYLMADMDELAAICARHRLALIEDAAQAHGALWRGRRAGTLGDLGTFSMQQTKVLTAGEGGAVLTDDYPTYRRLQQLRADSSVYVDEPVPGGPGLEPAGEVMGTNYCLTEMQAAILLASLETLDAELDVRDANARYLNRCLAEIPGLLPLKVPSSQERLSVFEYAVARDPAEFAGRSTEVVCRAVGKELGLGLHMTDEPLDRNVRFRPGSKAAWRDVTPRRGTGGFEAAHRLRENLIVMHHSALLEGRQAMDDIAEAFAKVAKHADELPAG